MQIIGGVGEIVGGVGIGIGTSWSGIGIVGGILMASHGLDNINAGIRGILCGEDQDTYYNKLLQKVGWSEDEADWAEFWSLLPIELATMLSSSALNMAKYPLHDGALWGKWSKEVLDVGTKLDRYGLPTGFYLSPKNTLIEMRALPPSGMRDYHQYEVIKELPISSSRIRPYYGRLGLGKQYRADVDVNTLLNQGYLREIK